MELSINDCEILTRYENGGASTITEHPLAHYGHIKIELTPTRRTASFITLTASGKELLIEAKRILKERSDQAEQIYKANRAEERIRNTAQELLKALEEINLGLLLPKQAVKIAALIAKARGINDTEAA